MRKGAKKMTVDKDDIKDLHEKIDDVRKELSGALTESNRTVSSLAVAVEGLTVAMRESPKPEPRPCQFFIEHRTWHEQNRPEPRPCDGLKEHLSWHNARREKWFDGWVGFIFQVLILAGSLIGSLFIMLKTMLRALGKG